MDDHREKVIALYQFLKEFCSLKYKEVTNLSEHIWTCPLSDVPFDEENIKIYNRDRIDHDEDQFSPENADENTLLSVHKPEFQQCPTPPKNIADWLAPGWDKYTNIVKINESRIVTDKTQELFNASEQRVADYRLWFDLRATWADKQRAIATTRNFFTTLYNIHTNLGKNSETEELMVANGLLTYVPDEKIKHPLLLKRVKTSFDAKDNIIKIEDTETDPELYTVVLQRIPDINHNIVQDIISTLHDNFYHPLDRTETVEFLKTSIHKLSSKSLFVDSDAHRNKIRYSDDKLIMYDEPMFLLRKRVNGAIKAIEEIIENVKATGKIPQHLIEIVSGGKRDIPNVPELSLEDRISSSCGENAEILLAKEANREQLEIAQNIETYNAVVVQGPPGTGKTHTIANLLGDFLAQGKSVLVTSQAKKALTVLKDKIPLGIQNLCVSVLDDTHKDMERSVDGIADYLSRHNQVELKREAEAKQRERLDYIHQLAEIRKKIYTIKCREFHPVIYDGKDYSPIDMAEFVEKNPHLSYIPGKVAVNTAFPLTREETCKLFLSNAQITASDETELRCDLPEPKELLSPERFEVLISTIRAKEDDLQSKAALLGLNIECDYKGNKICSISQQNKLTIITPANKETLDLLSGYIQKMFEPDEWMVRAAVDGRNGGGYRSRWDNLVTAIMDAVQLSGSLAASIISNKEVVFAQGTNMAALNEDLQKTEIFLRDNPQPPKWKLLFHKEVQRVFDSVSINGQQIETVEECSIVRMRLKLSAKRDNIREIWDALVAGGEIPNFDKLDDTEPERICRNFVEKIRQYLDWYKVEYQELNQLIHDAGFNIDSVLGINALDSEMAKTKKILHFYKKILPIYIKIASDFLESAQINLQLTANKQKLLAVVSNSGSDICRKLINAEDSRDTGAYRTYYNDLATTYDKYDLLSTRRNILQRLKSVAADLAAAIEQREGIWGAQLPPESLEDAWRWKQFAAIIDEITAEPFETLQKKSLELSRLLRAKTAELVEARAWQHLLARVEQDISMQQALMGWKVTNQKLGKKTGKNVPMMMKMARIQMEKCQLAVPAWIMTINNALETLNPTKNVFDVIIIDEASQSDVSALAIAYMAKKIIIVGDNKQVSPLAVGTEMDQINNLMSMNIKDILPNWHLFGAQTSLYDIASTTFQSLMLCEHFRCMPDIIGFSNRLSYDYKIKPLRDTSKCKILPSVVNYRVLDGHREGKLKKNMQEAKAVVAFIEACIEQTEYENMTFGVISLLGDEQAELIQQLLDDKLGLAEVEKRQITCGNAAHFQGDERDVMFLSMVDSNEGELPLGKREKDSLQQRYNVAASRARNQMWVIHSLDAAHDLKQNDIRRELLEYSASPKSFQNQLYEIEAKSESPFEKAVAKSLITAGFHIVQQWEVGPYRIDIVVITGNKKIAVECDGEQFHSGDDKIIADMERQTILERIGWRFIRIRGSEYYRNPDAAMRRVFNDLRDNEIYPEHVEEISEPQDEPELLKRVKIRAEEILRAWNPEEPSDSVFEMPRFNQEKDWNSIRNDGFHNDEDEHSTGERVATPGIEIAHDSVISTRPTQTTLFHDIQDIQAGDTAETDTPKHRGKGKGPRVAEEKHKSRVGETAKKVRHTQAVATKDAKIIALLKDHNIGYIFPEHSGLIWVIYNEAIKADIEKIAAEVPAGFGFDKRGSNHTGHKPAWYLSIK